MEVSQQYKDVVFSTLRCCHIDSNVSVHEVRDTLNSSQYSSCEKKEILLGLELVVSLSVDVVRVGAGFLVLNEVRHAVEEG